MSMFFPIITKDNNLSYNKMSLLRPPNIKTASLLRLVFPSPKWHFSYDIIFDIKTTSLIRPLLGSPKGGLNIGVLLYFLFAFLDDRALPKWDLPYKKEFAPN